MELFSKRRFLSNDKGSPMSPAPYHGVYDRSGLFGGTPPDRGALVGTIEQSEGTNGFSRLPNRRHGRLRYRDYPRRQPRSGFEYRFEAAILQFGDRRVRSVVCDIQTFLDIQGETIVWHLKSELSKVNWKEPIPRARSRASIGRRFTHSG
jgi:hypothetical protein